MEEASKIAPVRLELWSNQAISTNLGRPSQFTDEERLYAWQAVTWVDEVALVDSPQHAENSVWANGEQLQYAPELLAYAPPITAPGTYEEPDRPRVVVTGCFDWLHSGHIRFFEEASTYGELTVVVGSDKNVSLLKGPHHPMFSQDIRRYVVSCVRHVHQAWVSTGSGWMDAAPEIERLQASVYVVNEDGDKPEKAQFCRERGLHYVVLKRAPAEGLPARESTQLRGF